MRLESAPRNRGGVGLKIYDCGYGERCGTVDRFARLLYSRAVRSRKFWWGIGYNGHTLYGSDIKDYVLNDKDVHADDMYLLEMYTHENDLKPKVMEMLKCIVAQVPVHILTDCISVSKLREMAALHRMRLRSQAKKEVNKL